MAYSSYPDPRSRSAAFLRSWFNLPRWTIPDKAVAAAGPVFAVAIFLPWFKAQVTVGNPGVSGILIDPPGTVTGLAAHGYLLVPLAVALLESAMIAVRYLPDGRAVRLPFHRYVVVAASAVVFLVTMAGALLKPPSWFGVLSMPPNFHVAIVWDYGALAGVAAAVISLGVAVAALRSDGI